MRTKNALKTFLYGILFTSIIALLGLVKTKVLLHYLGEEYVGLYQLFIQLYAYLSLVEGGIGASMAFHLYEPIYKNDTKKINSIFLGARKYFNIIGIIIIALGFSLSIGIMFLIKETTIAAWYIRICFILFVLSSTINYFTSAHAILYESEQKLYKSSNLNHLLSICESIVAILVAVLGGNLILILTLFLVMSIIKNIILVIRSRKDHTYLKEIDSNTEIDMSFKKEANNLIISKFSTLINENIDVLLLSSFVNLTAVVIYTSYNQIVTMIKQIIMRLNSALLSGVGNLLVSEKNKAKDLYNELNALLYYIGSLLFVPLFYVLTPFISLWYGKEYTVNMYVCLLFVLVLFINIIKIPLETFVKAAGEFKSVKTSAIYQSIVNCLLSLILVTKYGIAGVLGATVFAFITGNFIHYPRVIAKKIINDSIWNYYKKCLKYIICIAISLTICYFISNVFTINNLFMWLLVGAIIFIINFIITTIYYIVTKENKFFSRVEFLKRTKC